MRTNFLRFERVLTNASLWLASSLFAVASIIGLIQIVTRFFFKYPTPWSEVSIRILLIWMVFMGIPAGFRRGAMICVDLMQRVSPPWYRRKLELLIALANLGFLLTIAWWGYQYCMIAGNVQTIIGLEPMKMLWAYMSIPVGSVLAMVAVIGHYFEPKHEELETAT